MPFDWIPLLVATVSLMGFLFGLFKWQQSANEKKHEDLEKIFAEHKEIFDELKKRIEKNEDAVQKTREELHRDYVHREQQQQLSKDLHDIVGKIFNKVDHMAKDLNQLIGRINHD